MHGVCLLFDVCGTDVARQDWGVYTCVGGGGNRLNLCVQVLKICVSRL